MAPVWSCGMMLGKRPHWVILEAPIEMALAFHPRLDGFCIQPPSSPLLGTQS